MALIYALLMIFAVLFPWWTLGEEGFWLFEIFFNSKRQIVIPPGEYLLVSIFLVPLGFLALILGQFARKKSVNWTLAGSIGLFLASYSFYYYISGGDRIIGQLSIGFYSNLILSCVGFINSYLIYTEKAKRLSELEKIRKEFKGKDEKEE